VPVGSLPPLELPTSSRYLVAPVTAVQLKVTEPEPRLPPGAGDVMAGLVGGSAL
jgi:hypothetical protein